jgi:UDP-glucose 4-epimerase
MRIDGARILVTGGCGLIGSTTIDLLLRDYRPGRIVILDNLVRGSLANVEQALADPRVSLARGDIRDSGTVRAAMAGMDAVIHMATLRITACAEDPREAFEVMCTGSFNVVEAARDAGVRRIVTASSASVYGMAESFPTKEEHHPYGNRTWYGVTKTWLEGLLRSFHAMYGLPYVALRYFNVYGPRMDVFGKYTEVLVRWMECIAAGQPPVIFGDGTQTMDFIHVVDVARANVLALSADVQDRVYNVGSGIETSLLELLQLLLKAMDREDLQPAFQPARAINPVPRRLADVGAAARDLGFTATIPLGEGLRGLVRWRGAMLRRADGVCRRDRQ